MGTAAWVCFDCRSAVRRNTAHDGAVPCPTCGKPCAYLGYKIPVPPKDKEREWATLREQLARERMESLLASHARTVRERHDLEQEIARLEAMPENEGRRKAIRVLQGKLERMT
jgi:uncharacterized Zn finger protein (UPF0148 family)